jgi:acetyltransferase (GNAT) family protein
MNISVKPVAVEDISPWRDLYRREMNCQIVHDNLHARRGWTQSYLIDIGGTAAGYGSILIGGPWTGRRTAFEYYLAPDFRSRAFDAFERFLAASRATAMEVQTNDVLVTIMLHAWARNIVTDAIVFADKLTTAHTLENAALSQRGDPDHEWVIEMNGAAVAKGGILYHYNRPYGDIYMEVDEASRRQGVGCYLVQELKRICYQGGSVPCARCNPGNVASRKTLQKAGFVPFAALLCGDL